MMFWIYGLMLLVIFTMGHSLTLNTTVRDQCPNEKNALGSIRKRRHLAFPDGAVVTLTVSAVKTFMTHVPSGWNCVVETDVLYHLPDSKITNAHFRKKLHHRQKREFWDTMRTALELQNMNGRACIIRSICEARAFLAPPGQSLVHDIMRAIFLAPQHEGDFNDEIGPTYNELLDPNFCDKANDCPFSVLNFILDLNRPK